MEATGPLGQPAPYVLTRSFRESLSSAAKTFEDGPLSCWNGSQVNGNERDEELLALSLLWFGFVLFCFVWLPFKGFKSLLSKSRFTC